MHTIYLLLPALFVVVSACTPEPSTSTPDRLTQWVSPEAVEERVTEAEARLARSAAGRLVWESIEAHGGLNGWFSNGPLAYRFTYQRANGSSIDTYQEIDVWSSRAVHRLAADTTTRFGWTGDIAWQAPADAALGVNARFWALTPYYFVGVPFVFADPGVQHTEAESITIDGTTYQQVYITFGDNVGDAPDDYYYMLIDPATNRVAGVRYIVTYPGFYEPGEQSSERFMRYEDSQTVQGLTFPTHYRTFAMTDDGPGDQVTTISLTDVAFQPELPRNHFDLPPDGVVQSEW